MKHQKDITYAIVNIKDNRENISFGIKMTWTWKKHDSCFPIFFAFYVFFSLSPTIQGTLGKGESRPVGTSTSNSSRFLRRPSDYCSDITSMVSSLNRIFHLNHFKIFILMIHLQMMQTMLYWTFLWHMTQAKPVFFSNYLFIYLFIYLLFETSESCFQSLPRIPTKC